MKIERSDVILFYCKNACKDAYINSFVDQQHKIPCEFLLVVHELVSSRFEIDSEEISEMIE